MQFAPYLCINILSYKIFFNFMAMIYFTLITYIFLLEIQYHLKFPQTFLLESRSSPNCVPLKFPSKIHSSQVIDCVSILPLAWEALSLVCVLSVFFYFSLSYFFLFQLVLSLTSTHIRKIGNIKKVSKLQRIIAYCQESMPRWNFNINSKKLLENGN